MFLSYQAVIWFSLEEGQIIQIRASGFKVY